MLRKGQILQSEISHERYVVGRALGRGGFGETYAVARLDDRDNEAEATCLKITSDASSWHGEAYFGGLMHGTGHVVRMIDAFPIMLGTGRAARMRFCIEMELIAGGTVLDACEDGRLPWPEERVIRQLRLLLQPLSILHRLGTSHRDITPGNVFMGNRSSLKLGDFGIAKTALKDSGSHADAYARAYRPPTLGTWWSPADDVYQVGLLALTLCAGYPCDNQTKKWDVNGLVGKGRLQRVVKKAISVKSQRFPDAGTFVTALED